MGKIILNRKQFYDLVWKEPLSALTSKFQITYIELKKCLVEMEVPIPENGYWSKLKFRKHVEIKPLSGDYNGKNDIELIERVIDVETVSEAVIKPDNTNDEGTNNTYRVPAKLTNPDILILNTKEYFNAGGSFYWRFSRRFPDRDDVLDIDTTRATFSRALRIMDTLIKILRKRGHEIGIKYGQTHVLMYGQEIEIKLREKNRVVDEQKDTYSSRTLEPTGILSFMIEPSHYNQKIINDGQDKLENKIESIVEKLEVLGEIKREHHIKNEEWHRQYEEQKRIEKEQEERKEKELSDFKSIFTQAYRLHQSIFMRDYISKVEETLIKREQLTDDTKNWLVWARAKIDWYDPLINRGDEIFCDDDKLHIFKALFKKQDVWMQ